jgi:hypothetical protein
MADNGDSSLINATGLWVNESKGGKKYMAGNMGNVRVLVFKNEKKRNEKDPDYRLCFAQREQKESSRGSDEAPPPEDEDIPF